MHHPWRKPSAPPGLAGCIIPRIVDGFDGDHVRLPHRLNRPLNQPARNSMTAPLFDNINGVDDAEAAGFDDRWYRLPVVDAADEKTSKSPFLLSNIPNAGTLSEPGR